MNAGPQTLEVPFVAIVPAGHDVFVAKMRPQAGSDKGVFMVLDVTTSVLYCNDDLWGLFHPAASSSDPVGVLARWGWIVDGHHRGRVVGSVVSTTSAGDSNHARTRLFVEVRGAETAYR